MNMETTMKVFALTLSAAALLAGQAFAQDVTDTDGDGSYSLEELQVVYTDLSAEAFAALDSDANGLLSPEELQAALDAGTLVMPQ
jgi:hypothetical protein